MNLKNHRALVCGASQGIGRACAFSMAHSGAQIVALARNEEKLRILMEELPGEHRYIVGDLSQGVAPLVREELKVGPIDILVNNSAGPPGGSLLETSWENLESVMRTHLKSSMELTHLLLPSMKEKSYGRIVNVISTSLKTPIPNLGVSNIVRASVGHWIKSLVWELPEFVTINAVLPGATKTARLETLLEKWAEKNNRGTDEEIRAQQQKIPLKRFGQPEEVANAVTFLSSPLASYISGVALAVDGGRTPCF